MNYLKEYFTNYYVTFLLLLGFVIVVIANRKNRIEGVNLFWIYTGLAFALTLFENLEDWCDTYGKPVWILYFKAAVCYLIQPLLIILQLYSIAPIKRKLLLLAPFFIELPVVIADLFGLNIIYGYRPDHGFISGKLHFLPALVLCFYLILLMFYSLRFIHQREYSRGMIVVFVAFSAMATTLLELRGIITGYTTEIAVIEILIYYFYLSAVSYSTNQKKLYESRIELEQERNKLLVAQIQPHFIFNSLVTIQSLCYTDGDAAADYIDVFGDYLRANIDSLSSDKPIRFESELDHINHYVTLEKASTDVDFTMIYELNIRNFNIPPLTIQPIVENAIKHGALTRRDGSGVVKIRTEEKDGNIIITVTDNGAGKMPL
ncbi:MAG: histidine kinase [Ruminococcus sp.]|nr:histidine kinase [Ruminococcus sp.]MBR1752950.1 histidine kinase [Ruminococcus sp.]